ncbi:MAG TPA: hypothetical protein PK358_09605 [Spirochaetota bacterium]|nr:hypothetical protein [Spirochaetota bacterium]HPJ35077.1 hypothetical protein [Spirochaetota bacterium]
MYYIPLIAIGSFVFFAGLWCAVLSILSLVGGWNRLSKKFAAPEHLINAGKEHTFQSVRFRVVNYSLCVKVRITETGIILDVMKLFRFMHRPLFIPYTEMKDPSTGKFITDYIVFRLDNIKIEIYGSSAEEIRKRLIEIIA